MDKEYIIFQENGLFGAKSQAGEVVIPPQYMEMYSFNCGLAMVRDTKYRYGYINKNNEFVIPLGKYSWCDPRFICGFARVIKSNPENRKDNLVDRKWGIIDTQDNVIVPFKYDNMWTLNEKYLFSIKAFIGDKEELINLYKLATNVILDGLTYICTYSVEAFKQMVNCERLSVKVMPNTGQLYFTYGANIGYASFKTIPKDPVVAIVVNSCGKIFPILIEKSDIGKTTLPIIWKTSEKSISRKYSHRTSFVDYEEENWSDPYGDEQAYYGGWSREDVESGLADAYEGDSDARWNND